MLVVVLVYQQVENNLLTPTIQRKATNIWASFVIISVTVLGALLGVLGALVAVPLTASIQIVVQELTAARRAALATRARARGNRCRGGAVRRRSHVMNETAARTGRWRTPVARLLTVLGVLFVVVSIAANFVERQALDTDEFEETARQLANDPRHPGAGRGDAHRAALRQRGRPGRPRGAAAGAAAGSRRPARRRAPSGVRAARRADPRASALPGALGHGADGGAAADREDPRRRGALPRDRRAGSLRSTCARCSSSSPTSSQSFRTSRSGFPRTPA